MICQAPRSRLLNPRIAALGVLTLHFWIGLDPALAQISGRVIDQASGLPLPDALVTLQATTTRTTTASDGTFQLAEAMGTDLVIVGAKKAYFSASVTASSPAADLEIALDPVPQDDDPTYTLLNPGSCASCHPDQFAQWSDSPMNKAGTNTWVYDIYDGTGTAGGMGGFVYTRDSVHRHDNPNSECAACHQPEPWIGEPFKALDPIGQLSPGSLHGVSCEVCHKIAHIDETRKNFPGIYPDVVTFTRPAGPTYEQVMYGILGDADFTAPFSMRPSYQPQLDAEICAACHQDKNDPDGDGDFEEANGVISEPTYLEWLDSPYGDPNSPFFASCVDCHMPSYGADTVCSILFPPLERDPETIRHHQVLGTTPEFLENAVDLSVICQATGDQVTAEVSIANTHTGHHVPTGVTIRNMILLVEAWRQEDNAALTYTGTQTVHELGGVGDPAQGYYAGLPGKYYSKVNHDANGNGPTFFTDATGITFDNRIPALATDTTQYTFELPPGGGTVHVRARLIYRRSFRFLADAKGWTEDGHGQPLADLEPPYFGHLMEEAESVLTTTAVSDAPSPIAATELFQNQPNPANPQTTIRFQLSEATPVRLEVYNTQGQLVRTLVDGSESPGTHSVTWDGRDAAGHEVPSGIYLYRLEAGASVQTRRLAILR